MTAIWLYEETSRVRITHIIEITVQILLLIVIWKKFKKSKNVFVPAAIFEVSTCCRIQCFKGNTHAKIYLIRSVLSGEKIKMCKAYGRWTPSDSKSSHGLCLGELKMDDQCISVWPTNMERCQMHIYYTQLHYLLQNIKSIIIVE